MIIITGSPKSGKTTLSNSYSLNGLKVFHTDDLSNHPWSHQSDIACRMLHERAYDVMEGTIMVRALRKFVNHSTALPADRIIWMPLPKAELNKGQNSMADGCFKIWKEILIKLEQSGAKIEIQL